MCDERAGYSQRMHARRERKRESRSDVLDLILPLQCGGCGAPATAWCAQCAHELAVRADEPHLITPRLDPGVPVLSLGRYAGARREGHRRPEGTRPHRPDRPARPRPVRRAEPAADLGHPGHPADRRACAHPAVLGPTAWRRPGRPAWPAPPPTARTASSSSRRCASRPSPETRSACPVPSGSATSPAASAPPSGLAGPVLLIDDVVTTGATVGESVQVLQTARCPPSSRSWPSPTPEVRLPPYQCHVKN